MKIAFHTLGCKVNQYETEALKERFGQRGHTIVGEEEFADAYIINTCTVTSLADRKSRQYIRRMKKKNPDSIVAVTGCYAQVSPAEAAAIEGVDLVTGTGEKSRLVDYVEEYAEGREQAAGAAQCRVLPYEALSKYDEMGVIASMESRTRAYIKIQEGCDRFCAYCVIPYARGAVRSRALEEIVAEANMLLSRGFKELILTGINTALYGREPEFPGDGGIELILEALSRLPGDFRIRLSSLEPTVVNAEYVKRLLRYEKLCHHLHLSVQSGSDRILSAMNRRYDREEYLKIVEVLREFDPNYGLTTDIIVGFPGETEEDFMESLALVEQVSFSKVHAFKYSVRPGTAAAAMKDHVAPQVKNRRSEALIAEGERASKSFAEMNSRTTRRALLEEYDEESQCYTGYTDNYLKVYVKSEELLSNRFSDVYITGLYRDGVYGRI